MKLKVFIAGPYSSDPEACTNRAIDVAEKVITLGAVPFVPHLFHFWEARHPHPYRDWIDMDLEWLPLCDVVLRMEGFSPGADGEVWLARNLGQPVFESVDELAEYMVATSKGDVGASAGAAVDRTGDVP